MFHPIPKQLIHPGFRLPGALCDRHGRVLLTAGTELTAALCGELERERHGTLYVGSDWPENFDWATGQVLDDLEDASETISVASLRPGMRLAQDIYDAHDLLLLAAGMRVTPRFLDLLRQRSIHVVHLRATPPERKPPVASEDDDEESVTTPAERIDELLPRELKKTPSFRPVVGWRRPRMSTEMLHIEADRGLQRHQATSSAVAEVGETLQVGGKIAAASLKGSIRSFVDMVTLDYDLLPLVVSMQRTKDEYLFDHCVNVSLLSMTIGAQLGLPQAELLELGMAGLMQDLGMLRVPGRIRLAPRTLTTSERAEIDRHPLHTLDLLENVRGLPTVVRVVAYQVHERCDGSGYPFHRGGSVLHPYSKIVAVADMYSALTRPRPHRPARSPYEATKQLLTEASADRLDRDIVRAFLDSVALFPIGSIVELSNGRRARVLRSNPTLHTKPMVEPLDDSGLSAGEVMDLSQETEIHVIRALADQPRGRLETSSA